MISKFNFFFPDINLKKIIFIVIISVGYGLSTIVTIYLVSNLFGIFNSSSAIDTPLIVNFIIKVIEFNFNLPKDLSYLFISIGFLILMTALGLTKLFLISKICSISRHKLSLRILNKILKIQNFPEDEKHQGDLKSLVLDEAQQIVKQLLKPIIEILTSSIFIIFLLIYLFFFNFTITFFIFITFGLVYLVNFVLISSSVKHHGNLRFVNNNKRFSRIDDAFNLKLISTILKTLDTFIDRYSKFSQKMAYHQYKFDFISNAPKFFIEGFIFLLIFSLIFYSYSENSPINENSSFIKILIVYTLAGLKILPELQKIFLAFSLLKFGSSSQSGTIDIMMSKNLPILKQIEKSAFDEKSNKLILHFKCDACFRGKTKVLNDIKFKLFNEDKIAIKGKSGAGKTTLINAIMGLTPIKNKEVSYLFNANINFGYVPQETHLFTGTILENITLGRLCDKNKLSLINYYTSKLFPEFSTIKTEKFLERFIEDTSGSLSVGQKQRLGLLRAIFDSPDILILDEFTSALDEKSEEIIIEFVKNLETYKCLIIVGHKEKSTRICKSIYNLEEGNLFKIK